MTASSLLDSVRQILEWDCKANEIDLEKRNVISMIITRTPLRISFFGGGTDYPVCFREFGGAVLSTAIDKCCYITCRRLPPFFEYHSRVSYSKIENVDDNGAFQHPSVRACLKYHGSRRRRRDSPRRGSSRAHWPWDEFCLYGWSFAWSLWTEGSDAQ